MSATETTAKPLKPWEAEVDRIYKLFKDMTDHDLEEAALFGDLRTLGTYTVVLYAAMSELAWRSRYPHRRKPAPEPVSAGAAYRALANAPNDALDALIIESIAGDPSCLGQLESAVTPRPDHFDPDVHAAFVAGDMAGAYEEEEA